MASRSLGRLGRTPAVRCGGRLVQPWGCCDRNLCPESGRVRLLRRIVDAQLIVLHTVRSSEPFAKAALFSKSYHREAITCLYGWSSACRRSWNQELSVTVTTSKRSRKRLYIETAIRILFDSNSVSGMPSLTSTCLPYFSWLPNRLRPSYLERRKLAWRPSCSGRSRLPASPVP
jgi:hypothetical protein